MLTNLLTATVLCPEADGISDFNVCAVPLSFKYAALRTFFSTLYTSTRYTL